MLVFSKQKMLERLEREGRLDEIDDSSRMLMDKIDGLQVIKNDFKALVFDVIEYGVIHPYTKEFILVNTNDCIEK